jgi:hypothetical protein
MKNRCLFRRDGQGKLLWKMKLFRNLIGVSEEALKCLEKRKQGKGTHANTMMFKEQRGQ